RSRAIIKFGGTGVIVTSVAPQPSPGWHKPVSRLHSSATLMQSASAAQVPSAMHSPVKLQNVPGSQGSPQPTEPSPPTLLDAPPAPPAAVVPGSPVNVLDPHAQIV